MESLVLPISDCGRTKDKTKDFKKYRITQVTNKERSHEKITHKYNALSFSLFSEISKAESQSGLFSRRPNPNALAATFAGEDLHSTNCHICATPFGGGLFGRTKPFVCPLCTEATCKNCSSKTHMINPPNSFPGKQPIEVNLCDTCIGQITLAHRKRKWKSELSEAESSAITQVTKFMMELLRTIESDIARLRIIIDEEIRKERTTYTDPIIKKAEVTCEEVASFFNKFEKALRKVNETVDEKSTKRHQTIVNNIKNMASQFTASKMPEFRIIQQELRELAKLPMTAPKERTSSVPLGHSPRGPVNQGPRQIVTLPTIASVNPAVLSTAGGTVTISGENFSSRVVVQFCNHNESITSRTPHLSVDIIDSTELKVTVPSGPEGTKTIRVSNPDGGYADLSGILTYSAKLQVNSPKQAPESAAFGLETYVPTMATSSAPPKVNIPIISHDYHKPTINAIEPAQSPMKGGLKIVLTGTGFSPGLTLFINGNTIPAALSKKDGYHALTFHSPAMNTPGFVSVTVKNPNGAKETLPLGILYAENIRDPNIPIIPSSPTTSRKELENVSTQLAETSLRRERDIIGRGEKSASSHNLSSTPKAEILIPNNPTRVITRGDTQPALGAYSSANPPRPVAPRAESTQNLPTRRVWGKQ